MSAPGWGPRPGGPPSPPRPPASDPLLPLLIIGLVLAYIGLALARVQAGAAVVIFLTGALFAGGYFRARSQQRALFERSRRQHQDEVERWRQSRPEAVIARAGDPLAAVRELTRGVSGGVFL